MLKTCMPWGFTVYPLSCTCRYNGKAECHGAKNWTSSLLQEQQRSKLPTAGMWICAHWRFCLNNWFHRFYCWFVIVISIRSIPLVKLFSASFFGLSIAKFVNFSFQRSLTCVRFSRIPRRLVIFNHMNMPYIPLFPLC